ncbi:hypothetical protein WR25_06192 [Diploscapter pachys]|uniref:Copper transport protein n=1 Tax=Diploscapter pachys TaxID=2018661 RepID=A0A2A2LSI1_9BILA|nr:hypothetical protein WR25_06192 [Diploscapter pachys]
MMNLLVTCTPAPPTPLYIANPFDPAECASYPTPLPVMASADPIAFTTHPIDNDPTTPDATVFCDPLCGVLIRVTGNVCIYINPSSADFRVGFQPPDTCGSYYYQNQAVTGLSCIGTKASSKRRRTGICGRIDDWLVGSRQVKMDMDMTIHFGERETVLFKFWKTGSFWGMAVSCLITFLLCILYELLKFGRYVIAMWQMKEQNEQLHNQSTSSADASNGADADADPGWAPLLQITGITRRLFTKYRIAHGLLYGFQQLLAFTLMLIVMTFNGNLILSVVIGEAVGYFLFTGSPLFEAKMQECC